MNYSVVAIGALLILTGLAWILWGRFHFDGPIKTVELDAGKKGVDVIQENLKGDRKSIGDEKN